ncbi:MAG: hypothetical protein CH6_1055 [Candidatus Kapaibacterium sp.]|nr:MAG: hypothetical protein CH6_1055 [Candidatus Kapabacteria bacterium]
MKHKIGVDGQQVAEGLEPTYKELKHSFTTTSVCPFGGLEPTYKELKHFKTPSNDLNLKD